MLKAELINVNSQLEKENKKLYQQLDHIIQISINRDKNELMSQEKFKDLLYRSKGDIKTDGYGGKEFGYFINNEVVKLYTIFKSLGTTNVIDLGCGLGHTMNYIHKLDYNIEVAGYDNEPVFVKDCLIAGKLKDIITLTKEDIACADTLYFWEPFNDRELAIKFVSNLIKIMRSDQTIVYKEDGIIGQCIEESDEFKKSDKINYDPNSFYVNRSSRYKVYIKK